jgi:hypothetical protein
MLKLACVCCCVIIGLQTARLISNGQILFKELLLFKYPRCKAYAMRNVVRARCIDQNINTMPSCGLLRLPTRVDVRGEYLCLFGRLLGWGNENMYTCIHVNASGRYTCKHTIYSLVTLPHQTAAQQHGRRFPMSRQPAVGMNVETSPATTLQALQALALQDLVLPCRSREIYILSISLI